MTDKPSETLGEPNVEQASGKPKKLIVSGLIIAGLVGVTAAIGGIITGNAAEEAEARQDVAAARPLPVEARRISFTDGYDQQRQFAGLVAAQRQVDLGFQINGMVAEMLVDEGDVVAAGDIIGRLDTDRLEADRARLAASLAERRADAKLARQTLDRQRDLNKRGHASDQVLDEAVTTSERAQAAIAATEAQIALLDVDIEDASLTAPFAGTITRRMVDEGAVISAGAAAIRLIETGALEARVGLPPKLAALHSVGEQMQLIWRGESHTATLQNVLPAVGRNSRTVTAILDVPDAMRLAGATDGELLQLQITDQVFERGAWLPNDAMTEGLRGLWSVYTLIPTPENGDLYTVQRAEVEMLYAEAEQSYVAGTLANDDYVVWHGAHRLTPGQVVRVTPSPES
ncbi:MAG: efflux RND transporter periplasmic adaptor subunit [Alphaproteobacteria bacterium]|nr:efflux RND transporter periplasmic adaptor subunit [Alphaproteobacteria bacterium SS10]